MGDSITDGWRLDQFFPEQALCQSRDQRADYAANVGAHVSGCDRLEARRMIILAGPTISHATPVR